VHLTAICRHHANSTLDVVETLTSDTGTRFKLRDRDFVKKAHTGMMTKNLVLTVCRLVTENPLHIRCSNRKSGPSHFLHLALLKNFPMNFEKVMDTPDIWVRQNPLIFSIFLIVPSYKINYAFPNSYQALTSAASTIWLSGILSLETKGSRLRLNASQPVGWTSVFQHGDSHIYVARRVTRSYYWLSHVMFHCHAVFLFCSSVYLYLFIIKECMSVL